VGPSYQDVAKKYAGQKDAAKLLAESIRKGGAGKWGPVPMPAQPALSDGDLQTLAAWILGGAK
jgi:cytochrome c